MATHDYVIANASGAAVRADLNNALAAIVTNNSNATEPATTYAYQWWADTTAGQLKLRNAANDGWVVIAELDGTKLMEDGTAPLPGLAFVDDLDTGLFRAAANQLGIATNGVERVKFGTSEVVFNDGGEDIDFRIEGDTESNLFFVDAGNDSVSIGDSGRLLVGKSSSLTDQPQRLQVEGTSFNAGGASLRRNSNDDGGTGLRICKSRGTANGSYSLVSSGDNLGLVQFCGADGTDDERAAEIRAQVDGTPGANDMPGRLIFSTTALGASSPTERMRIRADGDVIIPEAYNNTTANAANGYVFNSGGLGRSTSSIKYKTNVETIEDQYSDALLNCRPVWYRSICKLDCPEHGWWGFIAEEVAEIDPRLVHWKTIEVTHDENGSVVETPCDPEPEGVMYDRFVPHLLNLIKRQKEQIEAQGTAIAALETRLTALEGGAA